MWGKTEFQAKIPVLVITFLQFVKAQDVVFPSEDYASLESALLRVGGSGPSIRFTPVSGPCQSPGGIAGTCLRMRDCPLLINLLRRDRTRASFDFMRRSICRLELRSVFTCCPNSDPFIRPSDTTTALSNTQVPTEDECGFLTVPRIIGGEAVEPGEFPWLVSIGIPQGKGAFKNSCGGTLITKRHVLSAAHCFLPRFLPITTHVRLGDYSHSRTDDKGTPVTVRIVNRVGMNYDEVTQKEDIMVLTLERDVQFGDYIRPLCLPLGLEKEEFDNVNVVVAGWGDTRFGTQEGSDVPLKAVLPMVPRSECQRLYSRARGAPALDSTQLCAGRGMKDTCQGDSGGPLIYTNIEKGRFYLIGVVSYGIECASPLFPGVYTRVSSYLPWILSNIK